MWGVEFDLANLTVVGTPKLIAEDNVDGRVATYALNRNGVMVIQRAGEARRELVLVDRRGVSRTVLDEQRNYRWPRFSPDGARIAIGVTSREVIGDIWIIGRGNGTIARVTSDSLSGYPEWARNDREVLFPGRRVPGGAGSILRAPADGGTATALVSRPHPMYESLRTV